MSAAAELESRVSRAIAAANGAEKSERELKLEAQVRLLADIAALGLALEIRGEQVAHDHEQTELASQYRDAQSLLLDVGAHWTARREQMQQTVEYKRAKLRLRERLQAHLAKEPT